MLALQINISKFTLNTATPTLTTIHWEFGTLNSLIQTARKSEWNPINFKYKPWFLSRINYAKVVKTLNNKFFLDPDTPDTFKEVIQELWKPGPPAASINTTKG